MRIELRAGALAAVATLLLLVPAHFFAWPAPYKKVRVFVLVPPQQILPGVRQIAVLDFTGDDDRPSPAGARFADQVISQLLVPDRGIHEVTERSFLGITSSRREGSTLQEGAFTNIFEVIERSRLTQLMSEQSLQASELVDEGKAVSFGQLLGVQAIVMGRLSYSSDDRDWTKEETGKTRDGREYTVRLPCITRSVTARYRARIVSAETGAILGGTEGSNPVSETACGTAPNTYRSAIEAILPSPSSMFDNAVDALVPTLVDYLTPHFELLELELEKITTREYRDLADKAAEAAEDLNVDEAYVYYWSIYEQDPYNPRVLYNLALLNEVVGNYQEARDYYEMAYQLKDEGRYEEGLERVVRNVELAEALAQVGIEITPYAFAVTAADIEAAMATKVEVKGRREDRVEVYAGPSEASEVVVQVPGGVSLTVIGEEGEWYCVELLGGNEGYIHKDKVKIKD